MKRIFCIIVLLISLPNALAITGEIGNARAIISKEWTGRETIERTILVRNPNEVKINIELVPSDEIIDIVEIIDEKFELQPGEEKKARYNLKIKEEGAWNGKINVFFRPEEGNSVVLSSNIILLVGNKDEINELPDEVVDDSDNDTIDEKGDDDIEDSNVDFGIKGNSPINRGIIVLIVIIIIVIAVIIGAIFLLKR